MLEHNRENGRLLQARSTKMSADLKRRNAVGIVANTDLTVTCIGQDLFDTGEI